MKIKDILKDKGPMVFSISPGLTVGAAVEMLAQYNVGSVLVIDGGLPVGILTERDVLRACHRDPAGFQGMIVGDVMTRDLIIGSPDDNIEDVMTIMTEKHIRHFPILADGRVAGLISIGDILKSLMQAHAVEIRYLRDYIGGATR